MIEHRRRQPPRLGHWVDATVVSLPPLGSSARSPSRVESRQEDVQIATEAPGDPQNGRQRWHPVATLKIRDEGGMQARSLSQLLLGLLPFEPRLSNQLPERRSDLQVLGSAFVHGRQHSEPSG